MVSAWPNGQERNENDNKNIHEISEHTIIYLLVESLYDECELC